MVFTVARGFQVVLEVRNLPSNAGDLRSVSLSPGLGRPPAGGHGNPLQFSCLENPMHRGAWQAMVHSESESEVAQSCPTLCDPVDCSPPGSSAHGILQARVLEWVAISFSRGSSRPRDQTQVSHIAGRRFNLWATRDRVTIFIVEMNEFTKHLTANWWQSTCSVHAFPERRQSLREALARQETLALPTEAAQGCSGMWCWPRPWLTLIAQECQLWVRGHSVIQKLSLTAQDQGWPQRRNSNVC